MMVTVHFRHGCARAVDDSSRKDDEEYHFEGQIDDLYMAQSIAVYAVQWGIESLPINIFGKVPE